MSIESCLNNKHNLVEVYVDGYEEEPHNVVKWCTECGAVVVDTEYDGRVVPGDVMEMRIPETFKKVWKYHKENFM